MFDSKIETITVITFLLSLIGMMYWAITKAGIGFSIGVLAFAVITIFTGIVVEKEKRK